MAITPAERDAGFIPMSDLLETDWPKPQFRCFSNFYPAVMAITALSLSEQPSLAFVYQLRPNL